MAKKSNMNELEQQANEILEKAKELGLEYNFLFTKTFANYVYNLKLLEKCKEDIDENGYTVSKEYIKGLANEQPSASLKQFNTSLTNANRTAETLLKIIKDCKMENGAEEVDPLLEIINGSDGVEEN